MNKIGVRLDLSTKDPDLTIVQGNHDEKYMSKALLA